MLSTQGVAITREREAVLHELSHRGDKIHQRLTAGAERLQLEYQPGFDTAGEEIETAVTKLRSTLHARRPEAIARGMTLIGPHRDEFRFLATRPANGARRIDVATYGSRGQQRTIALSLKLAEACYMLTKVGDYPVLLLDDILSELDSKRRNHLLESVTRYQQVLMTTTDLDHFSSDFLDQAILHNVVAGLINPTIV